MRSVKYLVLLAVLLIPSVASAQATLTGTVRDNQGGVLPGVTVEAASPALIEKVKTAVTDDSGQYRIVDLRAGVYTLTFTLPGFNTVRREEITLSGTTTLTIPVTMNVGGIQETITVTGETPVVDVQSARKEVVLDQEVIQTIPATRSVGGLLNATAGLTVDNNGIALSPTMTFFSANGGANNEGRMAVNGMTVGAARSGGVSSYVYDAVGVEEVAVRVGGGLGETDTGGPIMNIIPRSGGNSFRGTAFLSTAGDWSKGNNLNDELRAVGIDEAPGIIQAHDASMSYGGPILRDRLWFFGQYRNLDTQTAVEGVSGNANVGLANRWDWMPSEVNSRRVQDRQMAIARLAGQAGKSRIQVNYEYQKRCEGTNLFAGGDACHTRGDDWVGLGSTTQSPESTGTAGTGYFEWPFHLTQGQWTMPMTNKLLLEANMTAFRYNPAFGFPPPDGITNMIPVQEQSTNLRCVQDTGASMSNPGCAEAADPTKLQWAPAANYTYRGLEQWGYAEGATNSANGSASYVTGSHNIKVGYQYYWLRQLDETIAAENQLLYRAQRGVMNRVTYRLPTRSNNTVTQLHGIFAQDQYTRGRMTLSGAVRWDRASSYAPVEGNGVSRTSFLNPTVITFEKTEGVNAYNDISPRIGVGYDVFGNGRTALKLRWGKYLGFASNDPPFTSTNKGATIVATVNRNWADNDGDKVVDCDLLNNAAQGPTAAVFAVDTCAIVTGNDANFGKPGAATVVDADLLKGWGVRTHDYQTEVTLQQEVLPRVSAEVSYIHRTFHGFMRTDLLNRETTDYVNYTITAPTDSRLPGGGGYPITIFLNNSTRPTQNNLRREQNVSVDGKEREAYYDGVNFNVNARMRNGLFVSLGTQTGRRVDDDCNVVINFDNPDPRGCHDADPWQTTIRGLGSYTIPKIDVLVSATVRSQTPLELDADLVIPNTQVRTLLGGTLPPGLLSTGNSTISLTDPDHRLFASNRRTQVDMRFAKVVRLGRTRTDVGVDLWNLFNTNYATAYEGDYGPVGSEWLNPTSIYAPRFVRLNFTVSF
ncbi:MAG TPA: carboxypeptidase-like regulatory domain-containing protein [Vicinamibacterales bacterium]|nr:carboxypeptidase-like regulatory domain-containing protein [Vicinamibacterales bacterium]